MPGAGGWKRRVGRWEDGERPGGSDETGQDITTAGGEEESKQGEAWAPTISSHYYFIPPSLCTCNPHFPFSFLCCAPFCYIFSGVSQGTHRRKLNSRLKLRIFFSLLFVTNWEPSTTNSCSKKNRFVIMFTHPLILIKKFFEEKCQTLLVPNNKGLLLFSALIVKWKSLHFGLLIRLHWTFMEFSF